MASTGFFNRRNSVFTTRTRRFSFFFSRRHDRRFLDFNRKSRTIVVEQRYFRGRASYPRLLKRNYAPSRAFRCLLSQKRYRILMPENLPDSLLLGLSSSSFLSRFHTVPKRIRVREEFSILKTSRYFVPSMENWQR